MSKSNTTKRLLADKFSLRDRAATLRASVARLIRRGSAEPDPQRRAIMAGTFAAAVTAPLPALTAASTPETAPHPDRALFEARAHVERCRVASQEASRVFRAAHAALWRDLGPYPHVLLLSQPEAAPFETPNAPRGVWRARKFVWVTPDQGGDEDRIKAWTSGGLRMAIDYAVSMFGQGGTTPFRIRHWRSLIPTAEAFEARRATLEAAYRIDALRGTSRSTADALTRAYTTLLSTPATTPEGLAVIVRHLAHDAQWWKQGFAYECLIRSAAALSGVTLLGPDFDPARWVREWEAVGGRVELIAGVEWGAMAPVRPDASQPERDEVRRLRDEWGEHSHLIARHLDAIRIDRPVEA